MPVSPAHGARRFLIGIPIAACRHDRLPLLSLSAIVKSRATISVFIPGYLMAVMAGPARVEVRCWLSRRWLPLVRS
jgi:hypothetical protein